MKTRIFHSRPTVVGYITPAIWEPDVIASEPMLFSASTMYALEHGGPMTQAILPEMLKSISQPSKDPDYPYLVIDSRVHMLMPRMYPAIPGWHCDWTPRDESEGGQPNPQNASDKQLSYAVFIPSVPNLSCTEFVDARIMLDYHPDRVWGSINDAIERKSLFKGQKGGYWAAEDGVIIRFTGQTLHRASAAEDSGWRYFLRASYKQTKPVNQVRRQTQVYMLSATGW